VPIDLRRIIVVAVALLLAAMGGGGCGRAPSATASRAGAATARPSPLAARAVPDGSAACRERQDECTALYARMAPPPRTPGDCCPGLRCIAYTIYDYARCLPPRSAGEPCSSGHECASWSCGDEPPAKGVPGRGPVCLPSIQAR
jgi:hypothetical protein